MALRKFFTTIAFQIPILLLALLLLYGGNVSAATVISAGSTTVISIDPVLPKEGESFVINITGQWRDSCIPSQSDVTYEMNDFTDVDRPEIKGLSIVIKTNLDRSNNCGEEFNPTTYHLSVPVQSLNWNEMSVTLEITDPKADDLINWRRQFDLILGLYDIPPRLGSGYWVSEHTPYQGLFIQQQNNTVVFYQLTYNRTTGEPNWIYANGNFHGNIVNGVSYLVNWLSPVEGADTSVIPFIRQVQPKLQDLTFDPSSAEIRVHGVNNIWANVGLSDVDGGQLPISHPYTRWVFALGGTQLPPVVPEMSGRWDLYGFTGQNLEQAHKIEFRAGTKVGKNLYRFNSVKNKWVLKCRSNIEGDGKSDCTLINKGFGLSMHYNLDTTPFDSSLAYFNGNYAKAPLVNSDSTKPDQTGVLLRSGVHLPALDVQ